MISTIKYLLITILLLAMNRYSSGQTFTASTDSSRCQPPKKRELFHDLIDKEQLRALETVKKKDNQPSAVNDETVNNYLVRSLTDHVDAFQCTIENDSLLKDQDKVRYLRGMENLLRSFMANTRSERVSRFAWPDIIAVYEKCVQEDIKGASIFPVIQPTTYGVGYTVVKADKITFEKNSGYKESQDILILKYCVLYPKQTLQVLKDNPDMPFADSMVRGVSKKFPQQLYNYAQADNKLGILIRKIEDDVFIKTIAQMAGSQDGQQYFPFLDNIVKGKMTLAGIDSVKNDTILYYRLLVQTQMDYTARMFQNDTAFEFKALTARLEKKAREDFVDVINGLHNEDAAIRFMCIQPLTAQELYYLAVSSDGTIYTSSFVKGVYPLMLKKINDRGDSLLLSLNFDKYRKFIKMSAGYNTLSHFLGTFPAKKNEGDETDAEKLMKAFVGKLEKGNGLEDGVDVADSYASIVTTIQPLAKEMLKNVQLNYKRNEASGNKSGMAIYKILTDLFLSADTTNRIDLTKELGIPPVYEVPYSSLRDDSGRVIIQVFFYSDIKVQGIFNGFVNMFRNANWKINSNDQWVTISSVKGKPVFIYANKAPTEENSEDEKNQAALREYLDSNNLYPSITIHRGHSYTAPYTIEQMFPSSRIIFLGSCGGYQIIHDALEKAPDAHIIATKQIADAPVNRPFFQLLTDKVRNGSDINWIPFWKELDNMVTDKIFEDYMPPYKNLGAIFIKAYKIAMEGSRESGVKSLEINSN
jgi:hypothetical protein